ncbi:hypothetical protein L873DRAFT_1816555 [Choiromyces venosus 120613-1]|uniref:Uncharacterized protein n=1 Tax=Choiromyces venosus 120613-1 TaxID=1336337 RepID=A0A3N4J8Y7_9PEZI|nr:hypothetical protein L873DRAFT_1816555 [Choiromyces venosus 120613-1]
MGSITSPSPSPNPIRFHADPEIRKNNKINPQSGSLPLAKSPLTLHNFPPLRIPVIKSLRHPPDAEQCLNRRSKGYSEYVHIYHKNLPLNSKTPI